MGRVVSRRDDIDPQLAVLDYLREMGCEDEDDIRIGNDSVSWRGALYTAVPVSETDIQLAEFENPGAVRPTPRQTLSTRERKRSTVGVVHVLVIAGLAFPLDMDDTKWLEQRIRTTCVDASHRPRAMDALACLQLADRLAEEHPGRRLEPIELTLMQARGLMEYVLEPSVVQEHRMQEFSNALWGFIRDNS